MVEQDLGEATIVYEGVDGETVEKTVQNEHVAYFQDHWMVRIGENEQGRDLVRRIPVHRVYHVERTVEQFEKEVETLRDQVQSVAEDLRTKLLGGPSTTSAPESETIHIDVESGESVESETEEGETEESEEP